MARPRVLLADDHTLLVGAFEKLLAGECDIVGQVLNLTPRTVAFHKYRMMEQLKVKSTAELVQYAVKHHIV